MAVKSIINGLAKVNGTELYYEICGNGPPVLFIQGATGDGGTFGQVADRLADEFTVVTYDRRGNSRSPRPMNWQSTTVEEQAGDAAGLIEALGLNPAFVFGTSAGAIILLDLLIRHPDVLRGAIVHEPPLLSVLPKADEIVAMIQQIAEGAMARGGPREAMASFIRINAGEATYLSLPSELRERLLGNSDLFFSVEISAFSSYEPDASALGRSAVRVEVVAGSESRDTYYYEAARWVAGCFSAELTEFPGAHAPYLDRPEVLAEAIRSVLHRMR